MMQRRNLIRGLSDDEIQIIGVEFTISEVNGRTSELAMFSPQGLIIPRLRSANRPGGWNEYLPRITFHSTDGDFQIQGLGCPW